MMAKRTRLALLLCLFTALAGPGWAQAQTAPDTSAQAVDPEAASSAVAVPATIDEAYPDGLPAGSVKIDEHTLLLADGGTLQIGPFAVDDCLTDYQCFWAQTNYTGTALFVNDPGNDGTAWTNVPGSFDNTMDSWRNHDSQDAKWATGSVGGGSVFCMNSNSRTPDVNPNRNSMTSYKVWAAGQNPC